MGSPTISYKENIMKRTMNNTGMIESIIGSTLLAVNTATTVASAAVTAATVITKGTYIACANSEHPVINDLVKRGPVYHARQANDFTNKQLDKAIDWTLEATSDWDLSDFTDPIKDAATKAKDAAKEAMDPK